jgi:hypothetical protein
MATGGCTSRRADRAQGEIPEPVFCEVLKDGGKPRAAKDLFQFACGRPTGLIATDLGAYLPDDN